MPGFNLEIKSQKISEFSAESTSEGVDLDGTLVVTVNNTGVLPVYTRLTVSEFTVGDEAVLESIGANGGVVTGEKDIEVPFRGRSSNSSFTSTIEDACVSGTLSNITLKTSAFGAVKLSPGDTSETSSVDIESQSCNIDTGGSGGQAPGDEEYSINVDNMEIAGSGVDVTVSTSGVAGEVISPGIGGIDQEGGEICAGNVQLVDESVSGTDAILDDRTNSKEGNFNSYTFEFRDLGAEAPTTIRADVNMLRPAQLYTSETVEFEEGSGGGLFEAGSVSPSEVPSMDQAAEDKPEDFN